MISNRVGRLIASKADMFRLMTESSYAKRAGEPGICDFMIGNPHEMPLPGFVEALQRWSAPQGKDWFAYKMSEPGSRAVVAATLRRMHGIEFQDADIHMTSGAFAGLGIALRTVVDPGDEVIMLTPPWFFYDILILAEGGTVVRVPLPPPDFDLDVDAIEAAITPRTRAIIVNSPHNPSGRIYPPSALERLAAVLTRASQANGRPIYIISDEAYSHIVFDGIEYPSPSRFYPYTFLVYTYGKTLLTPGQRLGYIALPPTMPAREQVSIAIMVGQLTYGHAWPNALLQHALGDIEPLSIDVAHLQTKRDRMVVALRDQGYELRAPEGTFYLLVRSPLADDLTFSEQLAAQDVFVLPGTSIELPGYFRISLTANDEMIDRGLPRFAEAIQRARSGTPVAN
jgi:aspartate aminotransferase